MATNVTNTQTASSLASLFQKKTRPVKTGDFKAFNVTRSTNLLKNSPIIKNFANTQSLVALSSIPLSQQQESNKTNACKAEVAQPSNKTSVDTFINISGYTTTLGTAAVSVKAAYIHQDAIKKPVNVAIDRLKASNHKPQLVKARALEDANRPGGIKGKLFPNSFEYDAKKILNTREKVLSKKSVIGGKLSRELSKASKTIDLAESVGKRAGIVGLVAGPIISSISEVAKLKESATMEDKTTAGIVGSLKSMDNLAVGVIAGGVTGVVTSPSGPGAIAAATAAGITAEEVYKVTGADKSFNDFIDNSVAPLIKTGVEHGFDSAHVIAVSTVEAIVDITDVTTTAIIEGKEVFDDLSEYSEKLIDNVNKAVKSTYKNFFDKSEASTQ